MSLGHDVTITSSMRRYNVKFIDSFKKSLSGELDDDDVLIIDSKVVELYELNHFLAGKKNIIIQATEQQKRYSSLAPIIEALISSGFRKNNKLVAVGGGITQDITGFISSIMYRGVNWVFYPTTLLAQADSCIGGKTSINFGEYKNQLGNFYPPNKILIDVRFIDTLSDMELRSGIGEMCHFFLVSGERDYDFFKKEYSSALQRDQPSLGKLISRTLQIKKMFVERDEFDRKERLVLNYGHSFGHALESLSSYRLPHGIAVSYGMDIANFVSVKFNYISERIYGELNQLLSSIWGNKKLGPIPINQEKFESALRRDKKNVGSGLRLVLTKGVGSMFLVDVPLDRSFSKGMKEYFSSISSVQASM